jgi:undecaprenyl-diphosphatase
MHVLYVYAAMQIIFESLPVSSSGNVLLWMVVLQKFLNLKLSENILPDFDFLLHLPTIFIIGFFFLPLWSRRLISIRRTFSSLLRVTVCCALADTATVGFYFLWKVLGTQNFPLWVGFLCTTFLLASLVFFSWRVKKSTLQYRDAGILGVVQGLALLPGISRFASTLVVGIWLGYSYEKAFQYSFLIQVPLLGAAFLKGLWSLSNAPTLAPFDDPLFYLVSLGASLVSLCVFSYVFGMVKRRTIWIFAWYTLFLSVIAKVFVG